MFFAKTPCWTSLISLRNDTTLNAASTTKDAFMASKDSFDMYNSMFPQIFGLPSLSLDVSCMYSIQRAPCSFGFIPAGSFVLSYKFAGGTSLLYYSPMKNLAKIPNFVGRIVPDLSSKGKRFGSSCPPLTYSSIMGFI